MKIKGVYQTKGKQNTILKCLLKSNITIGKLNTEGVKYYEENRPLFRWIITLCPYIDIYITSSIFISLGIVSIGSVHIAKCVISIALGAIILIGEIIIGIRKDWWINENKL